MSDRQAPPFQPKWILQFQVFLLRHRLMGPMNKQFMVITTTGRKSGHSHSVPIGFAPDGKGYIAFNLGRGSNWYRNVLANPRVILEINGRSFEACGEPLTAPEQIHQALVAHQREVPAVYKNYLRVAVDAPQEDIVKLGERIGFVRFDPLA